MKILFISSGNSKNGISPIVKNQGLSLEKFGLQVHYFNIIGKGWRGYLSNVTRLRKTIIDFEPNILHAHYSLSAFAASLAKIGLSIPQVTSLMGSDTTMNFFWRLLIWFFNKFFWDNVIVKADSMKENLALKNAEVIPNGVNLNLFKNDSKIKVSQTLKYSNNFKNIIWVSNPKRYEKNYLLAEKSVKILNDSYIKLNLVYNIEHKNISNYMNAADILILTSLWEGSPNVIKEAMACNLPIVSTKVGDVEWLLDGLRGCYLADFDPNDFAQKIKLALKYSKEKGNTKGRKRLLELGLDSKTIAKRIIGIYNKVLDS